MEVEAERVAAAPTTITTTATTSWTEVAKGDASSTGGRK